MASDETFSILLAARPDDFRKELAAAFEEEYFEITCTEDGEDVVDALLNGPMHSVVIVTDDLDGIGGIDAIYYASQNRTDVTYRPAIFFMSAVRQDNEILELLRSRGVTDFLQHRAPVAQLLDRVNARIFEHRRAAVRHSLELELMVRQGEAVHTATTADISETGLCLLLSGEVLVSSGDRLVLAFPALDDLSLAIAAEVRWSRQKRRLFGKRTHIGLEFMFASEEERADLAHLISRMRDVAERQAEALAKSRYLFPS